MKNYLTDAQEKDKKTSSDMFFSNRTMTALDVIDEIVAQTLKDYKDWLRAEMGGDIKGMGGEYQDYDNGYEEGYNTAHKKFIGLIERERIIKTVDYQ